MKVNFILFSFFCSQLICQSDFRQTTKQFSHQNDNEEEKKRIDKIIRHNLRRIISNTQAINARPDDDYQFLVHKNINTKPESYRRLQNKKDLELINSDAKTTNSQNETELSLEYKLDFNPQQLVQNIQNLTRKLQTVEQNKYNKRILLN